MIGRVATNRRLLKEVLGMDFTSVEHNGCDTIIIGVKHFIPAQILDCGQCFRWQGSGNEWNGIAHGRRLEIYLEEDNLVLKDVSLEEFNSIWMDYFDLSRDYSLLRGQFSNDKALYNAMEFSPGLRIMQQNPWETLITFILSQNSNIPRIKGMVSRLCENFGKALPCGSFAFPEPEDLAILTEESIATVKSGYRAGYIIDAARRVSDGRINLKSLHALSADEARKTLMQIYGVGPKVAECVLLFGLGKVECFPLDVWMKRVMESYYPEGFPETLKDTAGIAQQFLFHYARMNKI